MREPDLGTHTPNMLPAQKDSLLGVFVADAAALGHKLERHPLYSVHEVVGANSPTFLTPNRDHYDGEFGYFAHWRSVPLW